MRTNINFIHGRAALTAEDRGSTITIKWTDIGEPTGVDRQTGEQIGGTVAEMEETKKALVHFISPATNGYRLYQELEIGDAILDFAEDVEFAGRTDLTFDFAEETWVQKTIGQQLQKSWDVLFKDVRLSRSVLVTRSVVDSE